MVSTRILAASCVSAFLLMSVLAVAALPVSVPPVEAATNPVFDDLRVVHIGGGVLASQVVGGLWEMGAEVINSTDMPEGVALNADVVLIFGGEWFEERIYETELQNFLRLAWSRDAKLVMAGGTTSRFFEALASAGILAIPVAETGEVRNPAHDDPPVVGLGMKTVDGCSGPSIFSSCGPTPDDIEQGLASWLSSAGFAF